jgi:hypothetical protein
MKRATLIIVSLFAFSVRPATRKSICPKFTGASNS